MHKSSPFMAYRLPYGKFQQEDVEALKTMAQAGINLVSISTMNTSNSLGEAYSNYPSLWKYYDQYDFSGLDRQIQDVLAVNPNARFICTVDLNSPHWLARQLRMDSFYDLGNCACNHKWKDLTTKFMCAFLEYSESLYADIIEGYVLASGKTMEWIDHNAQAAGLNKSENYAKWCKSNGFEILSIPRADEATVCKEGFVRDPETDEHIIQWTRYVNSITVDLAVHFIATSRKLIRKEAQIGMFFGHIFHMLCEGQNEAERVFDECPPDFVIGAACNSKSAIGAAGGYIATLKMIQRRGIGYLHECDRLTSSSNLKLNEYITLSDGIWNSWKDTREDIAGLKREMAMCLINQFHLWWFNIWGQCYATPEVKALFHEMKKIWDEYASLSSGSNAEILLIHDPESNYYINPYNHPIQYFLSHELRNRFSEAGLSFDTASWSDVCEMDCSQYKMIVFQNYVVSNPERERILRNKVLNNKRLIVWFHTPGVIAEDKICSENTERLTGKPYKDESKEIVDFGDYRSVCFFKEDTLSSERLRDLAKTAGVHCYCSAGHALWHSNEFLMVHSSSGETVQITLPEQTDQVIEIFSNRIIAENSNQFTIECNEPDTVLFYLKNSASNGSKM